MSVQFNEKEKIALQIAGVPCSMDEFLSLNSEERAKVRRTVKEELLGPGLEGGLDLNDYGVALRSALDAMAHGARERFDSRP